MDSGFAAEAEGIRQNLHTSLLRMITLGQPVSRCARHVAALACLALTSCGRPFWSTGQVFTVPEACRLGPREEVRRDTLGLWAVVEGQYVASFWGPGKEAWRRPSGVLVDLRTPLPLHDSVGVVRLSWDSVIHYRYQGNGPAPVPDTLAVFRARQELLVPHTLSADTLVLAPDSASVYRVWGHWSTAAASGAFCASRSSGWYHSILWRKDSA